MKRRIAVICLCLCAAGAAGCGLLPRKTLMPMPPESVDVWQRVALETPAPGEAPNPAAPLNPTQYVRAAYRASGRMIAVQAFSFPADASAFELLQKWPRQSGDVTFQNRNILVVCSAPTETAASVIAFARELEGAWFKAGPR